MSVSLVVIALAVAYGLAGFIVACRVATMLAWHFVTTHNQQLPGNPYWVIHVPGGPQWFGGVAIGSAAGLAWPATLALVAARGFLFAPPREIQIQRQKERIAELERELQIGAER